MTDHAPLTDEELAALRERPAVISEDEARRLIADLQACRHALNLTVREEPGAGETCRACGHRYATVYWLPDEVWALITPSSALEGGTLCPRCADMRARAAGMELYWAASINEFPQPPQTGEPS